MEDYGRSTGVLTTESSNYHEYRAIIFIQDVPAPSKVRVSDVSINATAETVTLALSEVSDWNILSGTKALKNKNKGFFRL